MKKINKQNGFTLIELLISIFIISLFVVTATTFQKDVFSLNSFLSSSLNAQIEARHVVKIIVTELRKAEPSSSGAYPISYASSTAITFYSDANNDGAVDKIRYFVNNGTLQRGVIPPTGNPIVYNSSNEKITIIINNLVSTTTPLFQYYSSSYSGTTSPMTTIDIPSIRLIKVTVIIDKDPNRSPVPIVVTSQVNLRNLKDNL